MHGLAVTNQSGVYQLYGWQVPTGELHQLTHSPAGKIWGSLSPDGRYLLFTRATDENSLNALWLIDTAVLGETPRALPINDVLFAQLSPDTRSIAYSTGERISGAPGWKAHNDLSIRPITVTASDVTVAKEMLSAGLNGARANVEINLPGVTDAAYVEQVRREL